MTFLVGMGVVLGLFSYQRIQREIALFESDFRKASAFLRSRLA